MRARDAVAALAVTLLLGLALSGCASTGAPEGWLPTPDVGPMDPYGAWATVDRTEGITPQEVWGEFLAVDSDSLYLMAAGPPPASGLIALPLGTVRRAKIAHFDPETGKASGWVMAGSFASLSHGWGAAISVPLWIIFGSTLAGSHSHTPLHRYPDSSWPNLRMYARFPQGPPPGIRQLQLAPRPGSPGSAVSAVDHRPPEP